MVWGETDFEGKKQGVGGHLGKAVPNYLIVYDNIYYVKLQNWVLVINQLRFTVSVLFNVCHFVRFILAWFVLFYC